jgi:hypothetical protein
MKHKLLLGTIAAGTLVAATTATAFATAPAPAPAPKQAVPAKPGPPHAKPSLVLQAAPVPAGPHAAQGKPEVVLASPGKPLPGPVTGVAAGPGKTLPGQVHPKVVPAK